LSMGCNVVSRINTLNSLATNRENRPPKRPEPRRKCQGADGFSRSATRWWGWNSGGWPNWRQPELRSYNTAATGYVEKVRVRICRWDYSVSAEVSKSSRVSGST
jgi:hypothetical protein